MDGTSTDQDKLATVKLRTRSACDVGCQTEAKNATIAAPMTLFGDDDNLLNDIPMSPKLKRSLPNVSLASSASEVPGSSAPSADSLNEDVPEGLSTPVQPTASNTPILPPTSVPVPAGVKPSAVAEYFADKQTATQNSQKRPAPPEKKKTTQQSSSKADGPSWADENCKLRLVIHDFSRLEDTMCSDSKIIEGVSWKIMVMPKQHLVQKKQQKCMGFFLQCSPEKAYSDQWSVHAVADMRMISYKQGVPHFARRTTHTYTAKENDWGYSCFMTWADILDENQGYIKDDTVILEIAVKAEAPKNMMTREQFVQKVEKWLTLAEMQHKKGNIDLAIEANSTGLKFAKGKDRACYDRLESQRQLFVNAKLFESIERIEKGKTVPANPDAPAVKPTSLRQALTGAQKSLNGKITAKGTKKTRAAIVTVKQYKKKPEGNLRGSQRDSTGGSTSSVKDLVQYRKQKEKENKAKEKENAATQEATRRGAVIEEVSSADDECEDSSKLANADSSAKSSVENSTYGDDEARGTSTAQSEVDEEEEDDDDEDEYVEEGYAEPLDGATFDLNPDALDALHEMELNRLREESNEDPMYSHQQFLKAFPELPIYKGLNDEGIEMCDRMTQTRESFSDTEGPTSSEAAAPSVRKKKRANDDTQRMRRFAESCRINANVTGASSLPTDHLSERALYDACMAAYAKPVFPPNSNIDFSAEFYNKQTGIFNAGAYYEALSNAAANSASMSTTLTAPLLGSFKFSSDSTPFLHFPEPMLSQQLTLEQAFEVLPRYLDLSDLWKGLADDSPFMTKLSDEERTTFFADFEQRLAPTFMSLHKDVLNTTLSSQVCLNHFRTSFKFTQDFHRSLEKLVKSVEDTFARETVGVNNQVNSPQKTAESASKATASAVKKTHTSVATSATANKQSRPTVIAKRTITVTQGNTSKKGEVKHTIASLQDFKFNEGRKSENMFDLRTKISELSLREISMKEDLVELSRERLNDVIELKTNQSMLPVLQEIRNPQLRCVSEDLSKTATQIENMCLKMQASTQYVEETVRQVLGENGYAGLVKEAKIRAQEIEELSSELKNSQQQVATLRRKQEKMEENVDQHLKSIDAEQEKVNKMQKDMKDLRSQLKKAENRSTKEENRATNLQVQLNDLDEKHKQLRKELDQQKKKAAEERSKAKKDKERDTALIRQQSNELAEKESEKDQLKRDIDDVGKSKERLEREKRQLNTQVTSSTDRARVAEIAVLEMRLEKALALIASRRTEAAAGFAETEEMVKRSRGDQEALRKSLAEWKQALDRCDAANKSTSQEFENVMDGIKNGSKSLAMHGDIKAIVFDPLPKLVKPPPVQIVAPSSVTAQTALPPVHIPQPSVGVIGQPRTPIRYGTTETRSESPSVASCSTPARARTSRLPSPPATPSKNTSATSAAANRVNELPSSSLWSWNTIIGDMTRPGPQETQISSSFNALQRNIWAANSNGASALGIDGDFLRGNSASNLSNASSASHNSILSHANTGLSHHTSSIGHQNSSNQNNGHQQNSASHPQPFMGLRGYGDLWNSNTASSHDSSFSMRNSAQNGLGDGHHNMGEMVPPPQPSSNIGMGMPPTSWRHPSQHASQQGQYHHQHQTHHYFD